MVRLLFPAMAHVTTSTWATSTKIVIDHLFSLPVDTRNRLIIIDGWISSIVLPVMGVNTFILFVLGKIKNAELGLVVEHVKILILNIVMNEFGLNFLFAVSIGAKVLIRALIKAMRPMRAKAFPIRLNMILLFNGRVAIPAIIPIGTVHRLFNVGAHGTWVEIARTTSVLLRVVVHTMFVAVFRGYVAGADFEDL